MCIICRQKEAIVGRLWTPEEMEKAQTGRNWLLADTFIVSPLANGMYRLGTVVAISRRDEAMNIVKGIQTFYDALTDDEIELLDMECLDKNHVAQPPIPKKSRQRAGFVYVLRGTDSHYKIGLTSDPISRLKTFTVKLPFKVSYELVIPTEDMAGLEKELHTRFESKRVEGEWFALTDQDVNDIRSGYCNER
jgi:hypothetical protein